MPKKILIVSVDCEWGEFGEWGGCTQTCGEGIQTRTRPVKKLARFGGQLCTGYSTESKSCKLQACPGEIFSNFLDVILIYLKTYKLSLQSI